MALLSPLFNFQPAIVGIRRPPLPAPPSFVQAPPAPPPVTFPVIPGGSGGASPVVCPVGTQWDPYQQACVPVTSGTTLSGNFPPPTVPVVNPTTGVTINPEPSSVGEGPIYVNVANAVNLTDSSATQAIDNVASAVRNGIYAGTSAAAASVNQYIQAVQYGIDNLTTQLSAGISNAFQSIAGVVNGVEVGLQNSVSGIVGTVTNSIFNTINPLSVGLGQIVQVIAQQIGGLSGAIASAVAAVIPQIIGAITGQINPLTAVLTTISNEIGQNLADLVSGPAVYGGAIGGLDATLGRIFDEYTSFMEAQTGYPDGGNQHKDLSAIAKALAGLVITIAQGTATPKFADQIQTLCGGKDLDALLNKPWTPPQDEGFFASTWWIFMKAFTSVLTWAASIIPAIQKANQEVTQRLDSACPIDLLPASVLVDAVIRGFLPYDQAVLEASKGNLNESRFSLLKDLATQQLPAAQLVEALYRGIVQSSDFASALSAQGYTAGQQQVLQALGVSLLTVSESLELFRRQTIDAPTLDTILKSHAYDDAQRKALSGLAFRPQNINEAITGAASSQGLAGVGLIGDPSLFNAPESVQIAGAAEGLDSDATTAHWLSHWNIGSLTNWVTLYFRSQITLQQLQAVATREMVPASILPALIDSQRPLVQFRTIATALRAQIIDEANARLLLAQHGYSQNSIDVLIAYAQRPGPNKAAKNAQALHAVSLGIAKEEYIDGSITGDQYLAILTQHGYTLDGANTELQVVNAHQALLRRKEQAQLVIDEYGAGLIDEQAALAQLAVLGLTVDELARAAHKIRAFRTRTAKHPSEADLHHFLQLNLIGPDQYVAELVAQGYSKQWAQTFLAWRQAPTGPTAPTAAPATTAPSGGTSGP